MAKIVEKKTQSKGGVAPCTPQDLASLRMEVSMLSDAYFQLKKSSAALEESEKRYHTVFETSLDAIMLLDRKGFFDCNQATLKMFGYKTVKEFCTKHPGQVSPPTQPDGTSSMKLANERIGDAFKKASNYFEWIHRRANGEDFPATVFLVPFELEGKRVLQATVRDITERKLTEEALQERDQLFRKLAFNVPGMIFQFLRRPDGTYRVPFTSEAIKDIFGCSPQDVRDDFAPITKVILPEDFDRVVASIEYSAKHLTTWKCEYRVKLPGQPIKWLFGQTTPQKLTDGSVLWHGFNTDITERKMAEEAIHKNETELKEAQRIGHFGNFDWEARTDTIVWSDEYYRIYGLKPGTKPPGYAEHLKMYTTESAKRLDMAVKKSMKTGEPYVIDLEQARPDGTQKWVTARGEVKRDEHNRIIGLRGTAQDITEQKKAQEALGLLNAYHRSLIEASLDPMVTIRPNGNITDANSSAEIATGYSRKHLIGTDFSSYLTDPQYARAGFKQALSKGVVKDYPLEIKHKNGSVKSVLYNASVYRDGTGKVIGVFAAVHDITERKREEERLRTSEEKFRVLTENATDMIFMIDRGHRYLSANQSLAHVCRKPINEILGRPVTDFYPKSTSTHFIQNLDSIFQSGKPITNLEETMQVGDLTQSISTSLSPVKNAKGKVIAVAGIVRDVTEHKREEEALIKFKLGIERADQVIFITDLDGKITYANSAFEKVYGYKAKEILGKTPRIIKSGLLSNNVYKEFWATMLNKKVVSGEIVNKSKDGRLLTMQATSNPILDANGKIIGFMAIQSDITVQKQVEAELKKKVEQMEFVGRANLKRHKQMLEMENKIRELEEQLKHPKE